MIEMTLSQRWAPFLKLAISGSVLLDLLLCPLSLRGVPSLTSLNVWSFGERFCEHILVAVLHGSLGLTSLALYLKLASVYPAPARRTVVVDFVVNISAFDVVRRKVWQERPTGCLVRSARVDVLGFVGGAYDGALDTQDFCDLHMALFVFGGLIYVEVVHCAWTVWEGGLDQRLCQGPHCLAHVDVLGVFAVSVLGTVESVHDGTLDAQAF